MTLHHGDCVEVMAQMEPESVDAIVTDPPYGLGFMSKVWDSDFKAGDSPMRRRRETNAVNAGMSRQGGRQWRGEDGQKRQRKDGLKYQAWCEDWARAAYRVAKPSAYLLAFGGTRTFHRLACAIEDAGWIIRDTLVWGYASGFPKSKASLKPAWEPIVMARKPGPLRDLAIDACRIPAEGGPMPQIRPTTDREGASWSKGEHVPFHYHEHDWCDHAKAREYIEPCQVCGSNMLDTPRCKVCGVFKGFEQAAGRWPANIVLTAVEWYTLRDDVGQDIRELIGSYFETYGVGVDDVPRVRQGVRDHASVGARRSSEVLLPSMQLEGVAGGEAGRDEAPAGVDPADEGRGDGPLPGTELPGVEGRTVPRSERLRVGGVGDADGTGAGTGLGDDDGQVRPRASASDGDDAGPAATAVRGSASPQRGEGRQQPEQSVPSGSVESHPRASDGRPGTSAPARTGRRARSRERGVTVPRDLIPDGWLRYFRYSHDSAIFDGGWEGVVGAGETSSGKASAGGHRRAATLHDTASGWAMRHDENAGELYGDSGTYSRFFLVPKADRADREPVLGGLPERTAHHTMTGQPIPTRQPVARQNIHPTVKPTDLMRHLVRLVTPAGGVVLDPFLGSGTTALAAELEGFPWIGIEREEEYVRIAEARLNGVQKGLGLSA